jgi:peptidoglycan/LPS O-acetylase OafA/YrhL
VAVMGFFDDPGRELVVLGGIVLLVWAPTLPTPRVAQRLIAPLAGASLYIYLTHFQVHPPLERLLGPAAAVAGSLLVGVAAWWSVETLTAAVRSARARRRAVEDGPAQEGRRERDSNPRG